VPADIPTHDGTTPFQLAIWQGRLDVCEWLLSLGVDIHQVPPRLQSGTVLKSGQPVTCVSVPRAAVHSFLTGL
jgi:hypothetical protein